MLNEGNVLDRYGYGIPDSEGKMPRMALWNAPGSDVTGEILFTVGRHTPSRSVTPWHALPYILVTSVKSR